MEIKGFITNLGKYNEGELVGKWIEFPIDEEELNDVLEEIGCCYTDENGEEHNSEYEEYFFTDWETSADFKLGEYESIDRLNELFETFEDWDEDLLNACLEIWSLEDLENCDADDFTLYTDIEDNYDLGYYWVEDSGAYDTSELGNLANYIDYEAFGRDIALEADGGFTSLGFVERM